MSAAPLQRAAAIPPPAADVRRTVLPNGLRVLTDTVIGAPSATFAVWVGVGGRDEPAPRAGASHFLEHLLFKGTDTRDALQIALAIDGVGGDMNAYTASEYTAYFAKVPATESDVALDVLLDVVADPALRAAEFESEREVILEELAAADDDPEDLVGVRLFESLFPDHPLGREVLGTESSIEQLSRDDVASFFSTWYRPSNLVVTGSGLVDHDALVDEVARRFGDAPVGPRPTRATPDARVVDAVREHRPVELVHLALGWRTHGATDEDRFALSVLNHVFGTGPSSRLFQQVREHRGLTYSISSGVSLYSDAGALSVQCATTPSKAADVLEVVAEQVANLAAHGVHDEELQRAQRALRGSLVLGLEDSGSRGARLGVAETVRGEVTPLSEHLARIDAVTSEQVARVAARVLGGPRTLAVVGPGDLDHLV
ncbi:MAG: M16 family metallopeptidase [Microthrixaceae bacterium]